MMSPEQVQRTMEFILSSQANSAVRMDRLEEEHQRLSASLREQKESVDVLLSVTQDLVRVSKIQNERIKRLESKATKG